MRILKEMFKAALIIIVMAVVLMLVLFNGNIIRAIERSVQEEETARETIKVSAAVMAGVAVLERIEPPVERETVAVDKVTASGIRVPAYIVELTEKYGEVYGVEPSLIQAVIYRESTFRPNLENKYGTCFGLMQVSAKWHSWRLKEGESITDPEANIRIGTEYLSELIDRFGKLEVALMKYNGDSKALQPGYVSKYTQDVLRVKAELERK